MAVLRSLPPELVANIWSHLDIYAFAYPACTCRANYEVLKEPTVLAHYLVDRYGIGAIELIRNGSLTEPRLLQHGDKLLIGCEDDRIIQRLADMSILTREEREFIEELIEKYCYLPLPRKVYMTCMALILGKLPHLCISAMCNGWDPTESNQDLVFRPHLGFGMKRGSSSEADDIASVVTIMNLSRIGLALSPTQLKIDEMRTIWPTLSVTLGKAANISAEGFPLQDVAAVKYFKQPPRGSDYVLITIAFLAAWFKVAADNIPENEPTTVEAIFDVKWGHSMVDKQQTFAHNPTRQRMFDLVASNAVLFVENWQENHSDISRINTMVEQLLEPPLRQFAQRIGSLEAVKRQAKQHGCKKPLVLFAFDECTLLSEFMPRYQLRYPRFGFEHIGKITDLPVSVWLLLLDTSSEISKFRPGCDDQRGLPKDQRLLVQVHQVVLPLEVKAAIGPRTRMQKKVYPCLKHWKVGKEFGYMVSRVSDGSINEDKTMFDDTLIQEVDDHLYEETP